MSGWLWCDLCGLPVNLPEEHAKSELHALNELRRAHPDDLVVLDGDVRLPSPLFKGLEEVGITVREVCIAADEADKIARIAPMWAAVFALQAVIELDDEEAAKSLILEELPGMEEALEFLWRTGDAGSFDAVVRDAIARWRERHGGRPGSP